MKKFLTLTLLAVVASIASFAMTPISGPHTVCTGNTIYLTDSLTPGGTWSSSNPSVATIGTSSGIVSGIAAGVTTITYTDGIGIATHSVTVDVAPAPITGGGSSFCVGSTTSLSDATPGGTWSSGYTWIATVSSTGVVTGVSGGTAVIYYTIGTSCSATKVVTVDATTTGSISGPTTVCAGSTITLTDSFGLSGTWSSSSTSIATVGTSGVVTGVSAGTVTISFTTTGACGTGSATHTVTVLNTTSAGTIVGASSVAMGTSATLTNPSSSAGPHTWSSSNPAVATIGSSSGVVTGVSLGTTTITYSVTGCGGTATTTANVTVVSLDGISGHVNFGSGGYWGLVTVYLIKYNPSTLILSLYDSTSYYSSGTSLYYQFTGIPTDSFRVKAAVYDSAGITTGYIPTYHTNHFYWHDADVIYHTSGTSNINEDINMAYGTTTSGPGFIGGSVLTGANKGTSGSVPVVGLRMCIVNSATTQIMGLTHTDATGNYSFNNLPVGQTYFVFPDSLNYQTIPYTSVTLTSATPSMTAASFVQHTLSKTITPILVGIKNTTPVTTSIEAFPNPTSNRLYIQWNETTTENATIVLTDMAGREVLSTTAKMNQGTGMKQIDLSTLANGLYFLNINAVTVNYSNKIQVQH
jgi:uncharacterized protein YjdB